MKRILKICLAVLIILLPSFCLAKPEPNFAEAVPQGEGWELDPDYSTNPIYIGNEYKGTYYFYVRKGVDNNNQIKTETFLTSHKTSDIYKSEDSGNVIHPQGLCPNCGIYHEDARNPVCGCDKIEPETDAMNNFKNMTGWNVISEVPDEETIDYTCHNKEVYGENAYESKVTCTIETMTVTIQKNDSYEKKIFTQEVYEEQPPEELGDINKVYVRNYDGNHIIFNVYPESIARQEYNYLQLFNYTGIEGGYQITFYEPGHETRTYNLLFEGKFFQSQCIVTVVIDFYVVDFDIWQIESTKPLVTDDTALSAENVYFVFKNFSEPPENYYHFKNSQNQILTKYNETITDDIKVGKNDYFIETRSDDLPGWSKLEHFVILDTTNDDGTKNADFTIWYQKPAGGEKDVTDDKFIAIKPDVSIKLKPNEDYIQYNGNTIKWLKETSDCNVNTKINPNELNKETNFTMQIIAKDGTELTPIDHYTAPYSPVPIDDSGKLKEDGSLRIISVRDLRWENEDTTFYVTDAGNGDVLKPSNVNLNNPLMGYAVEFNLNTDNHNILKPKDISINVKGINGLKDATTGIMTALDGKYSNFKIDISNTSQTGSFLTKYTDVNKLWNFVYYLPPIVTNSSGTRPATVGIDFDIYINYADGTKINYLDWVKTTNSSWDGSVFTYNGTKGVLDDLEEFRPY